MSTETTTDSASTRRGNAVVNGILNVDKPPGMTSMDVVRRIKRAGRQKRVGHGGTLDPAATGVIPICLGQATRMMEYLIEGTREYHGVIRLGVETDTYDGVGQVTDTTDPSSTTLAEVEEAVDSFSGEIEQVPPMYSALKRDGKRLYELARAGIEVEREARKVQVQKIEVAEWSPPDVTIDVTCGRGFYMRSLAYDLGRILGCGGHLSALARVRAGPFKLSDSLRLEDAERKLAEGEWEESLHSPDEVVGHLRASIVGKRLEGMIRHGRPLPTGLRIPLTRPGERSRLYGVEGNFLAIVSFNAAASHWQPERVFS